MSSKRKLAAQLQPVVLGLSKLFCKAFTSFAQEQVPHKQIRDGASLESVIAELSDINFIGKGNAQPDLFAAKELIEELKERYREPESIKQRAYELYTNLRRPHNLKLLNEVISGKFSLKKLANMAVTDLASDDMKRRRKMEEIKYLNNEIIIKHEIQPEEALVAVPRSITCNTYIAIETPEELTNITLLNILEDYYSSLVKDFSPNELKKFNLQKEIVLNADVINRLCETDLKPNNMKSVLEQREKMLLNANSSK